MSCRAMRRGGIALWSSLAILVSSIALAQTTEEKALAEALFRAGRDLLNEGKVAEACVKLEESQRVAPAAGTLLNLAVCHEREGRIATAWVEFQGALTLARRDKRPEREALASERLAVIESQLPKITVAVPQEARVQGLTVRRGSVEIAQAAWGLEIPIDPGKHVVTASAPGYRAWQQELELSPGKRMTVTVPVLVKDASEATSVQRPAVREPMPQSSAATMASKPEAGVDGGTNGRATVRTSAWIVGAVGLVATGVGGYFGLRAISKRSDADALCPSDKGCYREGTDLNEQARDAARNANIFVGTGAALVLASGALLWWTRSSGTFDASSKTAQKGPARSRFDFDVSLGPSGVGAYLRGDL